MPERIYTNRIAGQCRIHVEIAANEIADILDDFSPAADAFDATKQLHAVLVAARDDFRTARQQHAHEADISRT